MTIHQRGGRITHESVAIQNVLVATPVFIRACELADIPPTKRQYHRWRNKTGLARRFKNEAITELAAEARNV